MLPWMFCVSLLVALATRLEQTRGEELPPINPHNLDPAAAHVCQSSTNETYSQLESYTRYYRSKTNTWCLSIPPRCTEYRISSSISYRIKTKYRTRRRYDCCRGYKSNPFLVYCIPSCGVEDCNKDKSHGFCVTPGNCKCHDGFHGSNCESNCATGTWGKDCKNVCKCGSHGSCDPVTGNCVCHIGYTGSDCSQPCEDSFGPHCVHPCVCENNATCNNVNGRCTCKSGFYGAYCHKTCDFTSVSLDGCQQTCPCQKGTCNNQGGCDCSAGYKGQYCTEPCSKTEWGPGCLKTCTCYSGKCDSVTGECICKMGFSGQKCETQCPSGYYGNNCGTRCACQNDGLCYYDDNDDVKCNCSSTSYHGKQCSERDCPFDQYLVVGKCQKCNCQWDQTNNCDPSSGKCQCKPGFKGQKCEDSCSMPFYGQNCAKTCQCSHGDCNPVTGACSKCYPGFKGSKCDQPCQMGKWGVGCVNDCGCLNGADCHVTTGFCNCTAGFHGMLCASPCADDRYGRNCKSVCSCDLKISTCNPETGVCQCKPGYYGNNCKTSCNEGMYGYGCALKCSCYGIGTQRCDIETGKCICKSGWKGVRCSSKCPDSLWGPNCRKPCLCNNHGSCDQVTGKCQCYHGYQGVSCDKPCDGGYFGLNCTSQCRKCLGGSTCNHVTGECVSGSCNAGFTGSNCQTLCPHGTWGKNCRNLCASTCIKNGRCNPITGACLCYPGYMGTDCDRQCAQGMFGIGCASTCPCEKANTKSCDPRNGHCTCKNGFTGNFCSDKCSVGTWGPGCSMLCRDICDRKYSKGCDPIKGLPCICKPGNQGATCASNTGVNVVGQQTAGTVAADSTTMTGVIIAVSIAMLVLIVIIVLLVCYYGRKVRRMKEENLRVHYHANGHIPEPSVTSVENGSAGGVTNPVYEAQNMNNDRRYPHLSQHTTNTTRPQRSVPCNNDEDDFDDIAAEKLRVNTDVSGQRNKAYVDDDDDDEEEDRYTTLNSVSNNFGTSDTLNDHNIHTPDDNCSKLSDKSMMFTGPKVPNDERMRSDVSSSSPSMSATSEQLPSNQAVGFYNQTYDLVVKPSNIMLATTVNQPEEYLQLTNQNRASNHYDDIPANWETFSAEESIRGDNSVSPEQQVLVCESVEHYNLSQTTEGDISQRDDTITTRATTDSVA